MTTFQFRAEKICTIMQCDDLAGVNLFTGKHTIMVYDFDSFG